MSRINEQPLPSSDDVDPMNCPQCVKPLKQKRYAGSNVRGCDECGGFFVELRNVKKIERRVDKDVRALMQEVERDNASDNLELVRCPRCRCRMDKKTPNGVAFKVDECRNCDAVWFDSGELAKLQLAHESRSQTQELNRMRERLKNMTPAERADYEQRIAELNDLGSPMEQAFGEAVVEFQYLYWL